MPRGGAKSNLFVRSSSLPPIHEDILTDAIIVLAHEESAMAGANQKAIKVDPQRSIRICFGHAWLFRSGQVEVA